MRRTLVFLMLALLAGCSPGMSPTTTGGEAGATPDQAQVTVSGFLFEPKTLTVVAGITVTWTNQDNILHTVTSGTPEAPSDQFDLTMDGSGRRRRSPSPRPLPASTSVPATAICREPWRSPPPDRQPGEQPFPEPG